MKVLLKFNNVDHPMDQKKRKREMIIANKWIIEKIKRQIEE